MLLQMRIPSLRGMWASTGLTQNKRAFFRLLEAFLSRKQPTARELRLLIPKVTAVPPNHPLL